MRFFLKFIMVALCGIYYFDITKAQSVSTDGLLAFPELPKVKIKAEANTDLAPKKQSQSSKGIMGFWMSCKLSREVDNGVFGRWVTQDVPGIIYLWIPLKENNPFRYVATTEYVMVKQDSVAYGKLEKDNVRVRSGYTLSLSDLKEVNKQRSNINGENLLKTKLQQLDIKGLFSANAFSMTSRSKDSEFFGFKSSLPEPNTISKISKEISSVLEMGGSEIPGFVRDRSTAYPKITYTLGVVEGTKQPIDIGAYIDYDHKGDTRFCYRYDEGYTYKPSIEHYIAHLFYVKNTEGHFVDSKNYDVEFFNNYTKKFPDVLKVNENLNKSYDAITKEFLGNQVQNIRIKEYSLGLFNCEISCDTLITVSGNDRPIACTTITNTIEHNFSADCYPQFSWHAPLSATEFFLEIKKAGSTWSAKGSTSQTISRNYEQYEARQLFKDTKTNYNLRSEYIARISYKCGIGGDWIYSIPELRFFPNQSGTPLDGKNIELTANTKSLMAGGSLTITLKFDPKYSKVIGSTKSTIDLSYEGPGAHLMTGPLSLSVNSMGDQVAFVVKTKTSLDVDDIKRFKIVASFLDNKVDLDLFLKSSRYEIEEVSYDKFTFPPIPKLIVRNGIADLDVVKKIKAVSDQSLEGFFVECTLGINFIQSGRPVKKYLSVKSMNDYAVLAKPVYFWIPLKKNNPLRINAISQYRLGYNKILRYNESGQVDTEYEEASGNSNSDQTSDGSGNNSGTTKNEHTNNSSATEDSSNESNSVAGGMSFDFPKIASASVNHSRSTFTSINSIVSSGKSSDHASSQNENSWKGSSFTKTDNFSNLKRHKDNIKRVGAPIPYFEKVHGYIEPFIACSLSEDQVVNIENYIDYDYFASLTNGDKPTTVAECIRIVMEPNQFKPESAESKKRLDSYLKKFKQVKALDLIDLYNTVKTYLDNDKSFVLHNIEMDGQYVKTPISFEIPYHEIFALETYPTHCSIPVDFKPHHQFVLRDGGAISRFSWEAPSSATEFQLQIQEESKSWENGSTVYPIPRGYHPDHKQPMGEISFEDTRTPYNISSTYKARFRFKCGVNSEWSAYSHSINFTHTREMYQVNVGSITATRDSTLSNVYIITWDKLDCASGYYLEYAEAGEGFDNTRLRLSPGPGKTNPYDVLRFTNRFVYTSASGSFLFKITPLCNGMRGVETFKAFDFSVNDEEPSSCPPIDGDNTPINYYFNQRDQLVFDWDTDYQHNQYKLMIIEKGQSWNNQVYYMKTLARTMISSGIFSLEHVITDKKFYAGTTYIARVFAKCVTLSRYWVDTYLEVEFEGISSRPNRITTSSVSDHATLSSFVGLSRVGNRRTSNVSNITSPTLLVYANPVLDDNIIFSTKDAPLGKVQIVLTNISSGKQEAPEARIISSTDEVMSIQRKLNKGYYVLSVILPNGDFISEKFEKK